MKLKTVTIDGKTYAEVDGTGLPIYVHQDGREHGFDAASADQRITALNGEAMGHRRAKEEFEARLKAFEGIEDPAAARQAIQTLTNLDQKKLIDAGEVEKVKNEAIKAVTEQYAPVQAALDKALQDLHREKVGGAFSRSKVIEEELAIPASFVEAKYGNAFKVGNDGRVVGYYDNGQEIYSRTRAGEVASFDEALQILVSLDPNRDSILKGKVGAGGGAPQGQSGASGKATITRSEFAKLDPAAQMDAAGKATIVDG